MNYYFAARYSRNEEMRRYRDIIQAKISGACVTSRWIDQHGGNLLNSFVSSKLNSDSHAECWIYGNKDIEDVEACHTIVSFTGDDGTSKGGRHVEFGYAMALGKRLIIVGLRENIFHTHPLAVRFSTFEEFLEYEVGING